MDHTADGGRPASTDCWGGYWAPLSLGLAFASGSSGCSVANRERKEDSVAM